MSSFVGFGFGPIQAGLFLDEAFRSGAFDRLVVAEINAELVASIRGANGNYAVNVAARNGIEVHQISRIEIFNPLDGADHPALAQAVAEASEIATALPSVDFYDKGANGVAAILAEGLSRKMHDPRLPRGIVYAAENHNHAAEILMEKVCARMAQTSPPNAATRAHLETRAQFLNTVIGKMSRMVGDPEEIAQCQLSPMIPGADKAFLVEAFNRILITRVSLPGFERRIRAFEEKDDLLPFEEAIAISAKPRRTRN
ncbi:MAG: hypothetical protein NTX50_16075 [Candidatus Sumerlaeota bacterium]|nr:hypothetical protein [Candidatus Sumerlaeota bacterium]